jgi:hypothetical protein
MTDAPDPAGDFSSDVHRRVLAAVPMTDDELTVYERVLGDTELDLGDDDVDEILRDLEADGHVRQLKDGGWRHTKAGHDLLTGPPQGAQE